MDPAIEIVIQGRPRSIGSLAITRILPEARRRNVGPFVFLDHMGPVELPAGEGFDVPPHPHSARLHGLQLWVALPIADEEGDPGFAHHPAASLPTWTEDGIAVTLLMGELAGRRSPVTDPSRPFFADLVMPAGSRFAVPEAIEECAAYVAMGELTVAKERELVVRSGRAPLVIEASAPSRIALLGGPALDAPRFMEWNYVSSSKERIASASAAWEAGEFPAVAGEP